MGWQSEKFTQTSAPFIILWEVERMEFQISFDIDID